MMSPAAAFVPALDLPNSVCTGHGYSASVVVHGAQKGADAKAEDVKVPGKFVYGGSMVSSGNGNAAATQNQPPAGAAGASAES
jgi:hypothetical protein